LNKEIAKITKGETAREFFAAKKHKRRKGISYRKHGKAGKISPQKNA